MGTSGEQCCNTCRFRRLFEDIWVLSGEKRRLFRCEAKDTPVLAMVVERETAPEMRLETSCLSTFWCCRYEGKEVKE